LSRADKVVDALHRGRDARPQALRTGLSHLSGRVPLTDRYGRDRLDAACNRALQINARFYSSVHSILKNGLDSKARTRATEEPAINHPNIPGADYFH